MCVSAQNVETDASTQEKEALVGQRRYCPQHRSKTILERIK